MARAEPFRALLEEAYSHEGVPLPPSLEKPKPLERRLDQLALAGHSTPPRGTAISLLPRLESGLSTPPPVLDPPELPPPGFSAAAQALLDELDRTAELERPAAVDAALQGVRKHDGDDPDQHPSIFRRPTLDVPAQSLLPIRELPAQIPAQIFADADDKTERLRAPPTSAPMPRVVQILEDPTIPSMRRQASSNSNGRPISATDLYRLQLEFEDTPARPLPALASLPPPTPLRGVEISGKLKMSDLEDIADLDALARALGLEGVGDVSIPSAEGLLDEVQGGPNDITDELPALKEEAVEVSPAPPQIPTKPVIVRIPSRPKVTAEAREQARRLYLTAVDELGRGDRIAAIGHLRLAMHYDDGIPLYKELLEQLEKAAPRRSRAASSNAPGAGELAPSSRGSGLMVVSTKGVEVPPHSLWRVGR